MGHRCLMAVVLGIFLSGCSSLQKPAQPQDPNTSQEGIRITPDVVYGHKFGMALTFDLFQPQKQNGAGVIFINSGAWHSPASPNYYTETVEGYRLATDQELAKLDSKLPWRPRIRPLLDKGFIQRSDRQSIRPNVHHWDSKGIGELHTTVR